MCRRCHDKPETLPHILGECPEGKGPRIERHNFVVYMIEERAKEAKEQLFVGTRGPLRPDLVILTRGIAWVVDVTVRFEQGDSLKEAIREKKEKYETFSEAIRRDIKAEEVTVLPIVLGARGGFINETKRNLSLLGISSREKKERIIIGVIKRSVGIIRAHCDLA